MSTEETPNPPAPGKGEYNGKCNRTACVSVTNVHWYNHSTQMYYCSSCASMINRANYHDAQRLFGHDLCTKGQN